MWNPFFKEGERGSERESGFFKPPSHWLTKVGPEPISADPCSDPLPPHHSVSFLFGQTWSSMKMLGRKPTFTRTLFPRSCLRWLVYLGSFYSHSASAREPSPWSHCYRNEVNPLVCKTTKPRPFLPGSGQRSLPPFPSFSLSLSHTLKQALMANGGFKRNKVSLGYRWVISGLHLIGKSGHNRCFKGTKQDSFGK